MKPPEPLDLSSEDLFALKQRVAEGRLQDGDSKILQAVITTLIYLSNILEIKNTSIRRLRKMLFGGKTEKAEDMFADKKKKSIVTDEDTTQKKEKGTGKKPRKQKGHGRNGSQAYTGAEREIVFHPDLQHKSPCPECLTGKVYELKDPGVMIRIRGTAPVQGTIYELQKLRCNLCGMIFTAQMPKETAEEKYDDSARAMIALLKYGTGFPFYRLEKLQENLGIPLPSSTQWDLVEKCADKIHPVFEELRRRAAQGEVIYNDDTTNKVLELIKENKEADDNTRKGIFTTGIVSTLKDLKIVVFHTGRRHAGENLKLLLDKRETDKGPPIQMSDALAQNVPKDHDTLLANCMAHARRNFVDAAWCFPEECSYVIETLGEVYGYDQEARVKNMSPENRLLFHQEKSKPLMTDLRSWMKKQFDEHLVEPNSVLGKAISYFRNHWEKLTLFLSVPGVPLDNNLCERSLKRVILNRKNSLFTRTRFGAELGDMFMSLIHTCSLMKVNSFEYLVALQKHSTDVFKDPSKWMPWNYGKTICS